MKKAIIFAAVAMTMVGCSSDELVSNSTENNEAPIAFSVEKKNITRGTSSTRTTLESTGHYNFGVWAYKYKTEDATLGSKVMENFLVGYSNGTNAGYDNASASTYATEAGTTSDHKSPWFYEGLGSSYSTSKTGFIAKSESVNEHQYLHYWDLAYNNTKFYAYTPYNKDVKFSESEKKMTVPDGILKADYSGPTASTEFLYAGATAKNADKQDVTLKFYHLGAQVKLRFYEDIEGYDVKIIDVTSTTSGIQATPAKPDGTSYTKSEYYTVCGAEIDYSTVGDPKATATYGTAATSKSNANLLFYIPAGTVPEKVTSGDQSYAESPTTYYPVPQPTTSTTGFTFHVSYTLTAKDNGETITVHDARVFVPAKDASDNFVAAWQPNTIYYYTFKITKNTTGTTSDTTNPDITTPDVPSDPALYPIVFDGATIEDYENSYSGQNF